MNFDERTLTMNTNLYDTDFNLWLLKTALLLKEQRFYELDLDFLIEEIEGMNRSHKNEVMSRLTTIMEHLLNIMYWQSELEYNLRGWKQTIVTQRTELLKLFKDSPSLRKYAEETWLECYQDAAYSFEFVSGIKAPEKPPFSLENVLDKTYIG